MMTPQPALEHLMGAYLHQDWAEDGSVWDVIDLFMSDEPDLAELLPGEIEALLEQVPSEPELRDFLINRLGGYYLADADGLTYREWLMRIAHRVHAATA